MAKKSLMRIDTITEGKKKSKIYIGYYDSKHNRLWNYIHHPF